MRAKITVKTIEALIDRACQNDLKGPNLELNMAIVDALRTHSQHERYTAFYIIGYVNGLYGPPAMLALSLLDACVVNLGFSFQYIVGTKEFLNKLVWKFPVECPKILHQVMEKILFLIHKWYLGIASYPPYHHDLSNIRAMHRLLQSKGYQFPHVPSSEISIMMPSNSLKSKREMEEERSMIQNTRLKELLRRGKPEDLKAANELIKEMTGYDPDNRPNYMLMIEKELKKIKDKVLLLEKLMGSDWNGIDNVSTEKKKIQELYSFCERAYTNTRKLVQEDDAENYPLSALQDLNDTLHRVILKYSNNQDDQPQQPVDDHGQICLLDLDDDEFSNIVSRDNNEIDNNVSANSSVTDLRTMNSIVQEHPDLPKELTELMDLRFNGNLLL